LKYLEALNREIKIYELKASVLKLFENIPEESREPWLRGTEFWMFWGFGQRGTDMQGTRSIFEAFLVDAATEAAENLPLNSFSKFWTFGAETGRHNSEIRRFKPFQEAYEEISRSRQTSVVQTGVLTRHTHDHFGSKFRVFEKISEQMRHTWPGKARLWIFWRLCADTAKHKRQFHDFWAFLRDFEWKSQKIGQT
jgi:hypothetical protein